MMTIIFVSDHSHCIRILAQVHLNRKKYFMINVSSHVGLTDLKQYVLWFIGLLPVMFGARYAKDAIGFVIDKLYQFFIRNHPTTI